MFVQVCRPLLCLIAGLTATTPFALGQRPYRIVDHWKIGGTGGWDYLLADPPSHLVYVTHGPQVEVIDTNSGKVIATINGMKGTHGIALDNQGRYGYISDGGGNRVVVFDRHTFKTVTTIPAGENPDGIVFDPSTQTVWAFNGRSKSVTVIDTATNTVVATLDVPGKPEFPSPTARDRCTTTSKAPTRSFASTPARRNLPTLGSWPTASHPPDWPWIGSTVSSSRYATAKGWPLLMRTAANRSQHRRSVMVRMLQPSVQSTSLLSVRTVPAR